MSLRSMTGFARADGSRGSMNWTIEVRSVNGRGLDVRFRGPVGFEGLEATVRQCATKRFQRGSLQVNLSARRPESTAEVRLNEKALREVIAAARRAQSLIAADAPRIDGLLAVKGVLELVEAGEDEAELAARAAAIEATLEAVFDRLKSAREAEGARLNETLSAQVARIDALTADAEACPARGAEAIRARLREQIARVMGEVGTLDEARLYQEVALIATRADVEEELKRLRSHVLAARALLAKGGAVGRELDFLAQEMNREANTLCSKANAAEITRIGLSLKLVIDQFKEQVQNIE